MHRIATLAPALALALAVFSPLTGAVAQQAGSVENGTTFGNWVIGCGAETTQPTQCNLVQDLRIAESGALVARVLVTELQGGPALIGQVPIGAYLPSGIVYQVEGDDTPQRELIWQRCLGELCEGALALDDAEIERLSQGTMLLGYRPAPGSDPMILRIQLDGFGDGVAAIFGGN